MRIRCRRILMVSASVLAAGLTACGPAPAGDYPFKPVPFTDVSITDGFWMPRIETNRTVTIPYAFEQCVETGRVKNFEIAGGAVEGSFCTVYPFDDSDVYKIIEGASYALHTFPDPELDKYVDGLIARIAAAQEEDGYLYTARTIESDEPVRWTEGPRWSNLYMGHELYNMGHLYEAAVAHHLATGKRSLLDVALRNADLIASVFGPGKKIGTPGHQVIEMGLAKLYRITGEKKYLDLAKFFLDMRGRADLRELYGEYSQDHKPVIEQSEAKGHAVRATYMYAGMADIAALTGNADYIAAIDRIWQDVVTGKLYLTGGIGATSSGEAFGEPYHLPNASAYAETCAAIGNAFWNFRRFLLHGDARDIDVLERIIYNGAISGVALDGKLFFYPNPLASSGRHQRSPWFNCACCPSNITRFLPSIPGYIYATRGDALYVNLFVQGEVRARLEGRAMTLRTITEYPWEGRVILQVDPEKAGRFTVNIRIPGWARNQPVPGDLYRFLDAAAEEVKLAVNGESLPLELEKGYAVIRRKWRAGDEIRLDLPMPVRRVLARPEVEADAGRVALQRGPIVYCAEGVDNGGGVSNLVLSDGVDLRAERRPDLFDGVTVITGEAQGRFEMADGSEIEKRLQPFTAIPYYAWAHRGPGEMAVWLAREESRARPVPRPTLASRSRASASGGKDASAVNDLWEPADSGDHEFARLHWWPGKGTIEWVQLDLPETTTVTESAVYWFDDTGRGSVRVPASWRILYKDGARWKPVDPLGPYAVEKDTFNRVSFRPVRTSALRLEIRLQKEWAAGVHEWTLK